MYFADTEFSLLWNTNTKSSEIKKIPNKQGSIYGFIEEKNVLRNSYLNHYFIYFLDWIQFV